MSVILFFFNWLEILDSRMMRVTFELKIELMTASLQYMYLLILQQIYTFFQEVHFVQSHQKTHVLVIMAKYYINCKHIHHLYWRNRVIVRTFFRFVIYVLVLYRIENTKIGHRDLFLGLGLLMHLNRYVTNEANNKLYLFTRRDTCLHSMWVVYHASFIVSQYKLRNRNAGSLFWIAYASWLGKDTRRFDATELWN